MQQNLDLASPDIGRMRVALHQLLADLESDRDRVYDAITECQRKILILDEITTWRIAAPEGDQEQPRLYEARNGDAGLLVMPLAEAIVYLRQENPEITKLQVRERLEGIGRRIATERSNVGRAIHAAWIAADRRLAANQPQR